MDYIRIVNWEKFQHYGKIRNPPWVKLHNSILNDWEFLSLPDASKANLLMLWALNTKHEEKIPASPKYLQHAFKAEKPVDLQVLVSAGFIEICQQDASTMLAERKQDASIELEVDRELELEGDRELERTTTPTPPNRRAALCVLQQKPIPRRNQGRL